MNTGHPDFLTGHKAMAIISERVAATKAPPPQTDPKNPQRQTAATLMPNPSATINQGIIDGDANSGFFGSFFAKGKKGKPGVLENPPLVLKASGTLSEREYMETEVIKLLIMSYFNIVKRTVADLVPKAVMFNLVQFTKEELQRELLAEMYKKEVFDEALKESEFTVQRRKECKKMIEAMQKADEIINTV